MLTAIFFAGDGGCFVPTIFIFKVMAIVAKNKAKYNMNGSFTTGLRLSTEARMEIR